RLAQQHIDLGRVQAVRGLGDQLYLLGQPVPAEQERDQGVEQVRLPRRQAGISEPRLGDAPGQSAYGLGVIAGTPGASTSGSSFDDAQDIRMAASEVGLEAVLRVRVEEPEP